MFLLFAYLMQVPLSILPTCYPKDPSITVVISSELEYSTLRFSIVSGIPVIEKVRF